MAFEVCGNCQHYRRYSYEALGFCVSRNSKKESQDVCEDFILAPWIRDGKLISNPNKSLLQLPNKLIGHYIIRLCGNCDFWLPLITDQKNGFCQKFQTIYSQEKTCKSFALSKNLAQQVIEVIDHDVKISGIENE